MPVVSVSLPDELVQGLDAAIQAGGYKGRSEYLRAAVRHYLQDAARVAGAHVHGSLTLSYDVGNEARISEVRHAYHDVVLSMMHSHCEPHACMDVLLVGGPAARVQALQDTLERMREVRRARLVPIT